MPVDQPFTCPVLIGRASQLGALLRLAERAQSGHGHVALIAREAGARVAGAGDYPGTGYDVVAFFGAFHDLGDPEGAARHASGSLALGGTVLLVEPMAGESVAENLNPVGPPLLRQLDVYLHAQRPGYGRPRPRQQRI
jgi:hypothetical protein